MEIELIGIAIDCEWAEPMARFYEGLLGFEIRDLGPGGRWAHLFNPNEGVHIKIQGDALYRPPKWPEEPGELRKMLHFEVQVDDLEADCADPVHDGHRGTGTCLTLLGRGPGTWATLAPVPA